MSKKNSVFMPKLVSTKKPKVKTPRKTSTPLKRSHIKRGLRQVSRNTYNSNLVLTSSNTSSVTWPIRNTIDNININININAEGFDTSFLSNIDEFAKVHVSSDEELEPDTHIKKSIKMNQSIISISDDEDVQMKPSGFSNCIDIATTSQANLDSEQVYDLTSDLSLKKKRIGIKEAGILVNELLADAERILGKDANSPPKPETPAVKIPSCPICLEEFSNTTTYTTTCGHLFCQSCIRNAIKATRVCPICRTSLTLKKIHPVYL